MAIRQRDGIGTVALVTGGASGIGLAACQLLMQDFPDWARLISRDCAHVE